MDSISGQCSMDLKFKIELSPIYILTLVASSICKIQRSQLSKQSKALTCVSTAPTPLQETILIRPLSLKVPGVSDRIGGTPYLLES